jgi:hypothetical protein
MWVGVGAKPHDQARSLPSSCCHIRLALLATRASPAACRCSTRDPFCFDRGRHEHGILRLCRPNIEDLNTTWLNPKLTSTCTHTCLTQPWTSLDSETPHRWLKHSTMAWHTPWTQTHDATHAMTTSIAIWSSHVHVHALCLFLTISP